jgi:ABC-type thiamin/hydroxymethylpyrimidine transport system permease subunit
MTSQLQLNWTWRDVQTTALVGGVGGLALSPLLTYAVTQMSAAMAPLPLVAIAAGSSLLFVPSLICASLLRRPGAALAAALCSGIVLTLTTAFPTDSLVSLLLCGLLAEGAIAGATRYRRFTPGAAVATGGLLGSLAYALNLLGHKLSLPPAVFIALFVATLSAFVGVAWASFAGTQRRRKGAHNG